jgi:hypothetical protein
MSTTRRRTAGLGIGAVLFLSAALAGAAPTIGEITPPQGAFDVGLIFNTDNLLFGLESYRSGIGVKLGFGALDVRSAVDFTYSGAANALSFDLYTAVVNHLAGQLVSPYLGGFLQVGYQRDASATWAVPFSLGAVGGVEVYLLDFLSLFAEYAVSVQFVTTASTFDWLFDTGMDTSSTIGIVIYLQRAETKKK